MSAWAMPTRWIMPFDSFRSGEPPLPADSGLVEQPRDSSAALRA